MWEAIRRGPFGIDRRVLCGEDVDDHEALVSHVLERGSVALNLAAVTVARPRRHDDLNDVLDAAWFTADGIDATDLVDEIDGTDGIDGAGGPDEAETDERGPTTPQPRAAEQKQRAAADGPACGRQRAQSRLTRQQQCACAEERARRHSSDSGGERGRERCEDGRGRVRGQSGGARRCWRLRAVVVAQRCGSGAQCGLGAVVIGCEHDEAARVREEADGGRGGGSGGNGGAGRFAGFAVDFDGLQSKKQMKTYEE
eukprot:6214614-Pleurochrysis_carterae.AAC.7